MKVRELITLLLKEDQDAEVWLDHRDAIIESPAIDVQTLHEGSSTKVVITDI